MATKRCENPGPDDDDLAASLSYHVQGEETNEPEQCVHCGCEIVVSDEWPLMRCPDCGPVCRGCHHTTLLAGADVCDLCGVMVEEV